MPLVGICAGGAGRPASLPRPWPNSMTSTSGKMEDVLEVYERPYDPARTGRLPGRKAGFLPCRCPAGLAGDTGREARRDNEYERCGTANVFCAVEPKAGRHFTFADAGPFGLRVRSSCCQLGAGIPGRQDHSSGDG